MFTKRSLAYAASREAGAAGGAAHEVADGGRDEEQPNAGQQVFRNMLE